MNLIAFLLLLLHWHIHEEKIRNVRLFLRFKQNCHFSLATTSINGKSHEKLKTAHSTLHLTLTKNFA